MWIRRSAGATAYAAALVMPAAASAAPDERILEQNRALVQRYFEEVWNQGRVDVLDELLTPDYRNHSSSTPDPRPGPADLKPIVRAMRTAIPDLHYEVLDMVVAPDKVAVYLRMTGTHTAPLFDMPASGARIDVRQMQIEWIANGRIRQHWRITDELNLLRQIGQH